MRFWYFLVFRHDRQLRMLSTLSKFYSETSSSFILHVCEHWRHWRVCAVAPESLVFAYAVSTKILSAGFIIIIILLLLLYRQTAQTRMRRLTSTSKLLRLSAVGLRFRTAPNQGDFGDFHWDFRLSPVRYRLTHHTPWNKPYTTHPTQPNLI